jgi:uracil-DNA glycosylase family 4
MPTRWELFRERWKEGCGSNLCSEAQHVCLARGRVPCDILFVGEAPSIAADAVGKPFIGEIRAIMDAAIKKAGTEGFTHAFTNLVCCVPRNPEDRAKDISPPPEEAILACRRRLREFITLCKPKLIMAVGRHARCALGEMRSEEGFTAPVAHMPHPATVLYASPYGGHEFRRLVNALSKAMTEHLAGTPATRG